MKVTVFTPTYNRAYIIENLYKSLCRQTFKDFEWIVVDDGSTDNTESLFYAIMRKENFFPITYKKTSNGGKHRAINQGVSIAKGELFFIVDSDDYLTDNSLERIVEIETTIPAEQKNLFAGVCGCKGFSSTNIVGKTFEGDILDITTLERVKYNINGDKAEVFYTDVLRKYPFPEFEDEKFLTECVVWDKIAYDGLKLRFFNEIIYICDYLEDGLTAHYQQALENSPRGYGLYIYQCGKFGKTFGVKKWFEYYSFYNKMRSKMSFKDIASSLHSGSIRLYFRILGLKIFFKLYDK